ncbi:MAG: molecular chaperone DnaJ, partial [Actinobacteria bacterium]|nr:molecular chaperone DnaJ [Actinomycetota bacterium]
GGFGDIFDAFFGGGSPFGGGGRSRGPSGPPRGPDLETTANLSFTQAVFGTQYDVSVRTAVVCEDCSGSGAQEGTSPSTCPDCGGAGEVRSVRQTILGQVMSSSVCNRCGGHGEIIENPCEHCGGEGRVVTDSSYTVDMPAGIDSGTKLRLNGRGAVGPRGGPAGDLYVNVRVAPHERFTREGVHLLEEMSLTMTQAALGHQLDYETLDGTEEFVIPPGTQSGKVFRLKGRGVPQLGGRGRGDLLVTVRVETPTELGDEEVELLERLAELRGEEIRRPEAGLFSRIKSAFK